MQERRSLYRRIMLLHQILRQFRVIAICMASFFMWWTIDMWHWYQENFKELTAASAGTFGSMVLLAAGTLKWTLEQFFKKVEKDDHD